VRHELLTALGRHAHDGRAQRERGEQRRQRRQRARVVARGLAHLDEDVEAAVRRRPRLLHRAQNGLGSVGNPQRPVRRLARNAAQCRRPHAAVARPGAARRRQRRATPTSRAPRPTARSSAATAASRSGRSGAIARCSSRSTRYARRAASARHASAALRHPQATTTSKREAGARLGRHHLGAGQRQGRRVLDLDRARVTKSTRTRAYSRPGAAAPRLRRPAGVLRAVLARAPRRRTRAPLHRLPPRRRSRRAADRAPGLRPRRHLGVAPGDHPRRAARTVPRDKGRPTSPSRLPRPGDTNGDVHPDLTTRLTYLQATDPANYDRIISFDPLIVPTVQQHLPVWRSLPIPVADRVFAVPPAAGHDAGLVRRPPRPSTASPSSARSSTTSTSSTSPTASTASACCSCSPSRRSSSTCNNEPYPTFENRRPDPRWPRAHSSSPSRSRRPTASGRRATTSRSRPLGSVAGPQSARRAAACLRGHRAAGLRREAERFRASAVFPRIVQDLLSR